MSRDDFHRYHAAFIEIFDDVDIRTDRSISEGDTIAAFCSARAIHRPTGQRVEFAGAMLVSFREGQIVEVWHSWDFLPLFEQIGAVPPGRMAELMPGVMGPAATA